MARASAALELEGQDNVLLRFVNYTAESVDALIFGSDGRSCIAVERDCSEFRSVLSAFGPYLNPGRVHRTGRDDNSRMSHQIPVADLYALLTARERLDAMAHDNALSSPA